MRGVRLRPPPTPANMALRSSLASYAKQRDRRLMYAIAMAVLFGFSPDLLHRLMPALTLPRVVPPTVLAVALLLLLVFVVWDGAIRPRQLGHTCPACSRLLTGRVSATVVSSGRCPYCQEPIP